jgi:hypothetical protein
MTAGPYKPPNAYAYTHMHTHAAPPQKVHGIIIAGRADALQAINAYSSNGFSGLKNTTLYDNIYRSSLFMGAYDSSTRVTKRIDRPAVFRYVLVYMYVFFLCDCLYGWLVNFWLYLHCEGMAYTYTYIHAYMHTCIHAYMHTCILAYMHTCMQLLRTNLCLDKSQLRRQWWQDQYIYLPTYTHACMHAWVAYKVFINIHLWTTGAWPD